MQLIIYTIAFLLLTLLFNKKKKNQQEHFSNYETVPLTAPTQTDIINMTPVFIDGNKAQAPGYDNNPLDLYADQYWEVKPNFSDIFNNQDIIKNISNADSKMPSNAPNTISSNTISLKTEKIEIPKEIKDTWQNQDLTFKFLGSAINDYYKQYYLIYESKIDEAKLKDTNKIIAQLPAISNFVQNQLGELNYQVYMYALVKMDKNKPVIKHIFGPRNKIEINDVTYLSQGVFELGPLNIQKLN